MRFIQRLEEAEIAPQIEIPVCSRTRATFPRPGTVLSGVQH